MANMMHGIAMIAVIAIITVLLRALPFLIFRDGKTTPAYVLYLGKVLPFAVMGMLVVFCLKNIDFFSGNHGIPELLAGAAVVVSYCWKRNTLLSVVIGTASYMVLIQHFFH